MSWLTEEAETEAHDFALLLELVVRALLLVYLFDRFPVFRLEALARGACLGEQGGLVLGEVGHRYALHQTVDLVGRLREKPHLAEVLVEGGREVRIDGAGRARLELGFDGLLRRLGLSIEVGVRPEPGRLLAPGPALAEDTSPSAFYPQGIEEPALEAGLGDRKGGEVGKIADDHGGGGYEEPEEVGTGEEVDDCEEERHHDGARSVLGDAVLGLD